MQDAHPAGQWLEADATKTRKWHPLAWAKDWIATGTIKPHLRPALIALADAVNRDEGHVHRRRARPS